MNAAMTEHLLAPDLDGLDDADEAPWPARQPFPAIVAAEPMTPDMLPEALRSYATDEAERMDVALEAVAMPLLVCLGAVIGRRLSIAPKRYDRFSEFPNLWGALVDRPSKRKSAALEAGDRFLRAIQADYFTEHEEGALAREAALKMVEAALKRLKAASDPGDLEKLLAERERLSVQPKRVTTNDATVERLHEILRANPRGVLVRRDELAGWLSALDRHGRESERAFFLEAWSGRGSLTLDRIGRGTVHAKHLCVGLLGTIQPAALQRYLGDCAQHGGDGLLARFGLLVAPEDRPPRLVDRLPDMEARRRVESIFRRVDATDMERVGAHSESEHEPPVLRFAEWDGAQELALAWLSAAGKEAHGSRAHPGFESYLAKLTKSFCGLSGILHVVDVVDGRVEAGPITTESARRAAALCCMFTSHARKVYDAADPTRLAAHALAQRIEHGEVRDFDTIRDLYRRGWSGLAAESTAREALKVLSDLGWVRIEATPVGATGGRPSEVIRLHPDFRGHR